MTRILKSRESDIQLIADLFADAEKDFKRDFLARVKSLKDDEKVAQIRFFIEQGRTDLALQVLDEEDDTGFLTLLFNTWLAASTLQILLTKDAMLEAQKRLFLIPRSFGFDPTDPQNAAALKEISLDFQNRARNSRRETFNYIYQRGILNNLSAEQIAKDYKRFAGLTVRQIEAVLNYENLLRQGSKQALDRALRDPQFDKKVLDGALSESAIKRMVDAYIRNQIIFRSEENARALAGDLINTAMENAQKRAMIDAGLNPGDLVKEWRSVRDKRVRFTHKPHVGMDGQIVGIDDYFVSPSGARLAHPRDKNAPYSETAGCRCWQLIYIKPENR